MVGGQVQHFQALQAALRQELRGAFRVKSLKVIVDVKLLECSSFLLFGERKGLQRHLRVRAVDVLQFTAAL